MEKCINKALVERRTKENSPGDPPRKAKDALKEKEGWDWDANAARQEMSTSNVGSGVKTLFVVYVATYEVTKWGEIILVPETGGASLVVAAATP